MSVLTAVDDEPIQILEIAPARMVDDEVDEETSVSTREYNVITNGSKLELSVFDVMATEPGFTPGRIVSGRKINNLRLRETESDSLYILEVEFIPFEYKTPFFVPIDWEWESSVLEIPAWVDVKGKPLVTTAGEPVIGLTRKIKLWNIRGTRNVPGVPAWFRDYGISVNSDLVKLDGTRFNPNELQLQRLSLGTWEEQTIDGTEYRYRPLSFEFWFNPLTWTTEVLNLGYNELMIKELPVFDEDGSVIENKTRKQAFPVRATDAAGQPTSNRVFLDRDGRRPRTGSGFSESIKEPLEPSDIVVLKFDLEDKLPYSRLVK